MGEVQPRAFLAGDVDFVARLRSQSFAAPFDADLWGRHGHVLERGGRPVAAMLARRTSQWIGGRPVPCVAISSVMVDLPHRSRGVMADLLEPVLEQHRDAGAAISTLTPSAVAPYRRAGFEVAGHRYRMHADPRSLRVNGECDSARWLEDDDLDGLVPLYDDLARRGNGPIARDLEWWSSHVLAPVRSGDAFAVVAERAGRLTGYAIWDQYDAPRQGEPSYTHRVRAREIVWSDRTAANGLLRALALAGSPGEELAWIGHPGDGLARHFDDPVLVDWARPWMVRVLDPRSALSARGYPLGLDLTVVVGVDGQRGLTPRTLRLDLHDGTAAVDDTTDDPDLTITADALPAVLTGLACPRQAYAAGDVHARSATVLDRLATILPCAAPWFFEHF